MAAKKWMIYGAGGYTGRLMARLAVSGGYQPILAGRSEDTLVPIANELGLEFRVFNLNEKEKVGKMISGCNLLTLIAGPHLFTAEPLINACLEREVNYIDIAGEISAIEYLFSKHKEAKRKGIVMIPSAGFISLASECLAKFLSQSVRKPVELEIGIKSRSRQSSGSSKVCIDNFSKGGLIRKNSKLIPFRMGSGDKIIDFPGGPEKSWPSPLAELATIYQSTGIPNIKTFLSLPGLLGSRFKLLAPLLERILSKECVKESLTKLAGMVCKGPSEKDNMKQKSYIWGGIMNTIGDFKQAWIETPEAYYFTALTGIECAKRIFQNNISGCLTPSQAFGQDFILDIKGVKRYEYL